LQNTLVTNVTKTKHWNTLC